ncbi:MAG: N-6 DNA methylase [Crenarchaeota archaeon]|nr:N-6 DNA methylase [Thermoproteota archaeon]
MIRKELDVQDKIRDILKDFAKRGLKFNGISIRHVKRDYDIEYGDRTRRPDIAVLVEDEKPLLLIETKKKYEEGGSRRAELRFHVTSEEVLGQAFSYAAILKARNIYVPFVATANDRQIAVFQVPEDVDKHVDWEAIRDRKYGRVLKVDYIHGILRPKYMLMHKPIRFSDDFFAELLDKLTGIYVNKYRLEEVKQELSWIIIEELRGFVDVLTRYILDALAPNGSYREEWMQKINSYAQDKGYTPNPEQLAREMAYVLLNKIIFYKVLEKHYEGLAKLEPLYSRGYVKTVNQYLNELKSLFEKAIETTNDFEPVFKAGIYDEIECIESEEVLKLLDWLITLLEQYEIEKFGDIVGHVYEELIPAEERHQLGQFYTPKPIAELIVKWCIRSPDDKVLDPGCGSGTFLIEAYKRLSELKLRKKFSEVRYMPGDVHKQILSQLYGIDINEFPAHITAMNLAMRNPKEPSSITNVVVEDFFKISPEWRKFTSYKVKTVEGEKPIEIVFEHFDAVVGNPPYTRWTEIPERTRNSIMTHHRRTIPKYNLSPRISQGVEPGIYVYWIMHSTSFLKNGGRLGMIISDSWLQTDYGIDFGRFLLDHFKVKALIDISARVFPVPLIGTCIILLEKCTNEKEREENQTVFMYVDIAETEEFKVDEILEAIEKPEKYEGGRHIIRVLRQGEIPKDQKWINLLFDANAVLDKLKDRTIRLGDLFEPSRGNCLWSIWSIKHGKRPDLGAKEFFYLDESKVQYYGLRDYAYPALTSARYAKWFTFTEEDWEELKKKGAPCYFFICHEPRNKLPKNVLEYIEWGETECRTMIRKTRGGGKICSQALACQEREKKKDLFYGWYDLGGVEKAPIMAIYQSQYKTRFILQKFPVATYHAIITFTPKIELTKNEIKALLSYLNSSFPQLYIESRARITGMGVAALEVKHAEELPILDVRRLTQKDLELLASLFDELEAEARRLGGADTAENVEKLWDTVIEKIDMEITRILELPKELAKTAKIIAKAMMRRRLQRAEEAAPKATKSKEKPHLNPSKALRKGSAKGRIVSLDEFMTRSN